MNIPHTSMTSMQASRNLPSELLANKQSLHEAKNTGGFQTQNPSQPQDPRFLIEDHATIQAASRYQNNLAQSNLLKTESKLGELLGDQRARLGHMTDMLVTNK